MNGFPDTTIDISDAELEVTLQKACVGTGLDLGTGIELARAALTMRHAGIDPAAVLSIALRHFDTDEAGEGGDYISAISDGPSVCDGFIAKTASVSRISVDCPLIVLAIVTETRSLVAIHSPWRAVRCPARWRRIRSSFVKNLPPMCWRTIVEAEMSARSTPHPGERFALWRTDAWFPDRRNRG